MYIYIYIYIYDTSSRRTKIELSAASGSVPALASELISLARRRSLVSAVPSCGESAMLRP